MRGPGGGRPAGDPPPAALALQGAASWAQLGTPAGGGDKPAPGATAAPRAAGAPGAIPGGPRSPRGARGLFLASGGRETGYVIHGTPDPTSIGGPAKAGCIALINQDIIDLYERSPEGTPVVVLM